MLHFRIQFQHEIKAFLVPYDAHWTLLTAKVTELFDVPPDHVALIHRDRDGSLTTIHNQEELRSYLLGPKSARAVAGLPLDFDLKDLREWRYSIVSHIPMSEIEDTEVEHESITELWQQAHTGKFTDEDYTFINRPPSDPTDVQLVIPGEETPYAVPRHLGIGASPNVQVMQIRQDEDNSWDKVQAPSEPDEREGGDADEEQEGTVRSVDYPHLEEPTRPQSVASSGPPRISSREKGKGRAMSTISLDPLPLYNAVDIDVTSNKSVINNETPKKPTIQIPEAPRDMGPIPLISNIVKKMSLQSAGREPSRQQSDEGTYGTLISQLVSLVDVVTQLLDDDGVAYQLRGAWEGMALKSGTTPMSAFPPGQPKPKELVLAEGIVKAMKRVQTIVEEDPLSDVEEQDSDVIWTHRPTPSSAFPKTPTERKTKTAAPAPAPAPSSAKSSKQRLEEAKALYKAEKARYRAERDHRRRNKLEARGYKYPDVMHGVRETDEPPIEVKPAPPGHRASLMSAPDPDAYYSRVSAVPHSAKTGSTVKPVAGSTYSPALLPTHLSQAVQASIGKSVKSPSVPSMREAADAPVDAADSAHDAGSEGPGTPKAAPSRPQRTSTQFDFNAFMDANAWNTAPRASPGWLAEQTQQPPPPPPPPPPIIPPPPALNVASTKRGSHSLVPAKKLSAPPPPAPPPRVFMQTAAITDSPHPLELQPLEREHQRAGSENTAPTPPPRPHAFSPSYSPPEATHGYARHHRQASGGEGGTNMTSQRSLKRNRWEHRHRMDAGGRDDSLPIDAHPPPVYSTDGEGGDELIESGGPPVRLEKGALPLNEEFKRRCLAVLHEYNVTQDKYPNLDVMITQGIEIVGSNRQMMRLAAESNAQARETILSEEVPNVVNRVLAMIQRGISGNYV